jgi:ATP-dependent Clp protease ATP-binding subunit ClpC
MAAEAERVLESMPRASDAIPMAGLDRPGFITPRLKRVMDIAYEEAMKLKDEYISTEHILLAIASERNTPSANGAARANITKERIAEAITADAQRPARHRAQRRDQVSRAGKYGRDLTKAAVENKLDPVIGRDAEVLRVLQVLSRRTKNNPVLIGEAGVGKTAIVEGLAQKIISKDVPDNAAGQEGHLARPGRNGGGHPLPRRV